VLRALESLKGRSDANSSTQPDDRRPTAPAVDRNSGGEARA
jgi:hypothetical protein